MDNRARMITMIAMAKHLGCSMTSFWRQQLSFQSLNEEGVIVVNELLEEEKRKRERLYELERPAREDRAS